MTEKSPAKVIRDRKSSLSIKNGYKSLLIRTIAVALVFWFLFSFVFLICQVDGNDMFPAIKDGDLVIAYRLQADYEKNDAVVYEAEGKRRAGRILALENDVIKISENGILYVNGTAQEGQIMYPTYYEDGKEFTYTVPSGHCYIIDDYRTQCEDSRVFGAIKIEDVEGKIISILRRRSI